MDPGSGAGKTPSVAALGLKKLIPLGSGAPMLLLCPRDGLLAGRPSVCRGLGGAFVRGNASCKGPVAPIFRRDCMV